MRKVFTKFDSEALSQLLDIANTSGRNYGSLETLTCQLTILEKGWNNTVAINEMAKWLMICTHKNIYENIPDIFHFALCCFVKVPLETPAKTIGSVINQHGRKQRCSLSLASLSSEVQIAWNGPHMYDSVTADLIAESLKEYLDELTETGSHRFHTLPNFDILALQ